MKGVKPAGILAFVGLFAFVAGAQEVEPVWEHLINDDSVPLPILKAESHPDETYDGTFKMDTYGGFERYDDGRLLLGIRDNGIDESDPNHDADLAAQYPDRSLIWINPSDGSPMGVALVVGFYPVPLDQEFLDAGGTELDYYFNFGVSDDGVIYVGYKNKIVRYAPDGNGGFSEPTVAYTYENDGSDYWHQWRFECIKVKGSGSDTVILAGGKTWRTNQGYCYLTTTDGETFSLSGMVPNGWAQASGGASMPITREGEEWVYVSTYPGSDSGTGTTFYRFWRPADTEDDFQKDTELFNAEKNSDAAGDEYRTEFISALDAHSDLDYVVVYSTPSWNSENLGFESTRPGWLALHDMAGAFLSAYQLDVTEDVELDPAMDPPAALWHGTLGDVNIYVPEGAPAGACEILWYSGAYGYGRYKVGDIPTPVDDWSLY